MNKLLAKYKSYKQINIFDGLEKIKLFIILFLLSNSHIIINDRVINIWVTKISFFSNLIFFKKISCLRDVFI